MFYMLASFLLASLMHGYVLFDKSGQHPGTISYHAVLSNRKIWIYRVGHGLNGLLILLMVISTFSESNYTLLILSTTIISVLAEWAQAVVPAKGSTDIAHTIFAAVMSFSMLFLVFVLTQVYSTNMLITWFSLFSLIILLSFAIHIRYPPKKFFWKLQLFGQSVLYLILFLLIYFK